MTKIIICPPKQGGLSALLCRALGKNGGALYLGDDSIKSHGALSPEFIVIERKSALNIYTGNTLIFLNGENDVFVSSECIGKTVAVYEYGNSAAELFAQKQGLESVSFGMNSESGVTVSSLASDFLSVCVTRSIPVLPAGRLEECEITVKAPGVFLPDVILPVCTALIICRKLENGSITL